MLGENPVTGAAIAGQDQRSLAPWRQAEARSILRLSLVGALMGVIGAVIAWMLYHLIMIVTSLAFYQRFSLRTPLYPPTGQVNFLIVLIPVVGGLLVGLMARYGTDRIRGHGIPEAMESVLTNKSLVSPRIAIFKPISAAIAVGTGGPFGAEGPIIQTGGAIGSLIGQALNLTAAERRTFLACGAAAGMVGIFNTPIAGVAIALELLLFEFRARSLVPVIIASAVAAACRSLLLGSAVMFKVTVPGIGGPLDLLWFVPLGIIIGLCAVLMSKALYIVEEFFDRLPISMIFKPALGAVVLGVIALFEPRILGMGYTTITDILNNHFTNGTLVGLSLGKAVALIASLGSGTSGGLLAPMLMIGAAIGSGYGRAVKAIFPQAGINSSMCGVVAMSGLFSAAARAPLTSFIFAFELTGANSAILPLMIGCMVADVVARQFTNESVMTERLARRGLKVNQGFEPNLLGTATVAEVMTRTIDSLAASMRLRDALKVILGEPIAFSILSHYSPAANGTSTVITARPDGANAHDADNTDDVESDVCALTARSRWSFPLVDAQGRLIGIVTRGEILAAASQPERLAQPLDDLATHKLVVAYADETVDAALIRMLAGDYALLPVVERSDPQRLVGVLSRNDVLRAHRQRQSDENDRERYFTLRRRITRPQLLPLPGIGVRSVPVDKVVSVSDDTSDGISDDISADMVGADTVESAHPAAPVEEPSQRPAQDADTERIGV
ncbi:MAG: chloride channel protein [Ktedonobacterales bacterium]